MIKHNLQGKQEERERGQERGKRGKDEGWRKKEKGSYFISVSTW